MTLEKAIEILELNVPFSHSPEASQIKEAIEIVKFALEQKNIEIHLEEAFLKECECEIENAKEQAVREFAEIMKGLLRNVAKVKVWGSDYYPIALSFIDTLVNELYGNPEQLKGKADEI